MIFFWIDMVDMFCDLGICISGFFVICMNFVIVFDGDVFGGFFFIFCGFDCFLYNNFSVVDYNNLCGILNDWVGV